MNRRDFLLQLPGWTGLGVRGLSPALFPALSAASTAASRAPGAATPPGPPAVAFFYGAEPPLDELRLFDWVVLEPGHALAARADVAASLAPHGLAFAYVSLGEVHPGRDYAGSVPPAWVRRHNEAWGSWVIDQTAPGWTEFFLDRIVAPLWKQGFRAFFLDTLDSYQLVAASDAERQAQAAALRHTLGALVQRFPGVRLMLNRGFELVDAELGRHVVAVAAESLYQRYDAATGRYEAVPPADRRWLLDRFANMRRLGLPGIAIDYVPPGARDLARETARRIATDGLIPWVADPALETLGVGSVEVVPRKVLLLHDPVDAEHLRLKQRSAHLYGALPLEYLGLVPEYREVTAAPPPGALVGRYAGVVLYLDDVSMGDAAQDLIARARRENVPGCAPSVRRSSSGTWPA